MKQIKATTFSKATLLNEFNGFGWLIQFVGVQKETKETFLESLLNTCQESFQERDRLLRSAGSSQSWVAFINFLNEMYLQVTLASSLWINQPISYHTLPLRSYVSNPRFQISLINIHETGETLFVEPLKCNLYQCKLVIPDKIFETCVHLKLRRENPFFFFLQIFGYDNSVKICCQKNKTNNKTNNQDRIIHVKPIKFYEIICVKLSKPDKKKPPSLTRYDNLMSFWFFLIQNYFWQLKRMSCGSKGRLGWSRPPELILLALLAESCCVTLREPSSQTLQEVWLTARTFIFLSTSLSKSPSEFHCIRPGRRFELHSISFQDSYPMLLNWCFKTAPVYFGIIFLLFLSNSSLILITFCFIILILVNGEGGFHRARECLIIEVYISARVSVLRVDGDRSWRGKRTTRQNGIHFQFDSRRFPRHEFSDGSCPTDATSTHWITSGQMATSCHGRHLLLPSISFQFGLLIRHSILHFSLFFFFFSFFFFKFF